MAPDAAIATRSLTKRYGDVHAVDSLDLDVRRGEIYGFLGRNGAGKTTTIRMLLGMVGTPQTLPSGSYVVLIVTFVAGIAATIAQLRFADNAQ